MYVSSIRLANDVKVEVGILRVLLEESLEEGVHVLGHLSLVSNVVFVGIGESSSYRLIPFFKAGKRRIHFLSEFLSTRAQEKKKIH